MVKRQSIRVMPVESGFAAIIVAIVLVLVLSLTTVGFAELMRKEQQNATNKHLSSQAYYAAETGINDAAKAINAGYFKTKTDCGPLPSTDTTPGAQYLKSNSVDAAKGASYTCLTIEPNVTSLEYSSISDQTKVVEITGADFNSPDTTVPIGSLYIGWQDADGGTSFVPSGNKFQTEGNWAYTGVLRVGITPLASGFINRTSLAKNTYTSFFYPNNSSTAPITHHYESGAGTNAGALVNGNCSTTRSVAAYPRYCGVVVDNLTQANYLITLRSVYKNVRVTIRANASDGSQLRIRNAQTIIDSTGKAQDVLRRVQVRVPAHATYDVPNYTVETTGSICKQLKLLPDSGSNTCAATP